jgi:hypothetical protein
MEGTTVTDEPTKERPRWTLYVLLAVVLAPLLYVLSYVPVGACVVSSGHRMEATRVFYAPVDWLVGPVRHFCGSCGDRSTTGSAGFSVRSDLFVVG